MDADDFLAHHGVKGMHWGVRRAASRVSSGLTKTRAAVSKPSASKPVHEDAATARAAKIKVKKTGLDSLSNQELQAYINRTNLEQQYSKLTPQTTSVGKKFATDLVTNTSKSLASQYATQYAKKGIDAAIKAAMK